MRPDCQHRGLSRELLDRVVRRFDHVRQMVLLTDDEPGLRAFYESSGFTEIADLRPAPFRAFVRPTCG